MNKEPQTLSWWLLWWHDGILAALILGVGGSALVGFLLMLASRGTSGC